MCVCVFEFVCVCVHVYMYVYMRVYMYMLKTFVRSQVLILVAKKLIWPYLRTTE